MFLGQSGPHRGGSDYLAISFIKGYVLLTWDLGAGPRRIFTPRPVDERINVHSVHIGRWPLLCLPSSGSFCEKLGKFTTKGIVGQGIMRRPDGHWTASNSGIVKGGLARQQLGFSIVLKQIAENLLWKLSRHLRFFLQMCNNFSFEILQEY